MPATRDGKTWRSQFYYEDWQGVRHKKNKRGFKTKAEAEEWERNFRQQQRKDLDINFENFVEIYFTDVENRLRESTIKNKRYVFDLKVTPYFKKKKMCEIKTSDIRAWQNELIKQGYAPTYLKSINNQLTALFNYAVRYYDLNDNPCRKAGSIGKSKADDMEFWTKQEFNQLHFQSNNALHHFVFQGFYSSSQFYLFRHILYCNPVYALFLMHVPMTNSLSSNHILLMLPKYY